MGLGGPCRGWVPGAKEAPPQAGCAAETPACARATSSAGLGVSGPDRPGRAWQLRAMGSALGAEKRSGSRARTTAPRRRRR
eukprot:9741950-Alexandrium_andersonii.AAC.1